MNGFEKFQGLIDGQKEMRNFLQLLLDKRLPKLEGHKVNFRVDRPKGGVVTLRLLEKSSTKSYIKQGEKEIIDAFKEKYPEETLKII